ncbi:carbohydrate kinase family protein [Paracoccus gahaiensis]|uniref:Carbohydrate kinase family protein n=1 Tax=Paracoccus gahaiensis TaxID=1706839 RepID=A0A4U0R5Q0_9RHOB|nr:carbohydrate kinase family protein [Paracoccus gahaiensis]TJZ90177.1 carbohydrate kinase family protein [Paracoccus gahaiensis]
MIDSSHPLLLCVGDIDMDLIIKVPRPPGRDQKVDGSRIAQTPGGMAANVAVAARRLGTATRILGAVGDDAMGYEAISALRLEGVDFAHIATRKDTATFFCIIMVDAGGEKALVKALSPAYLPQLADLTPAAFRGIRHAHLTFTEPGLSQKAIGMARDVGASISLDLEAADVPDDGRAVQQLAHAVDILFTSQHSRTEIEARIGPLTTRPDQIIVTTRGDAGARVERGSFVHEVSGHAVSVTDTSGAGDAFAAAFLHAHLGGADDADALRFANAAAALSTRAYGAQTGSATKSEVEQFLAEKNGGHHG